MKTFIVEEKFVGYADITIEAETEDEATVSLTNLLAKVTYSLLLSVLFIFMLLDSS